MWRSTEEIDAFYRTRVSKGRHPTNMIRFNDKLVDLLSRNSIREILDPRMLPMLAMPRPWIHFESGGYMSRKNICMRIENSPEQYHYLKEAFMRGHITKVLQGLDALGSQSWTINQKVFNVVLEAWNSGEAYPSIPSLQESPVLPPKPPNYDTSSKARKEWRAASKEAEKEYRRHHLQRCHVNYKIEIARMFLGETIYFPHNIDFLGRAYPIPPLFSHLDDDICRGLLLFSEGKELGENGLRWLKVHLANLAGHDRHSFAERIKFVEDNMENIYDSADNPLGGKQWWRKADDPWQCLAACIELTEAMRSPDPLKYKSRLPIHQDGICGGFQHYAALSSDAESALQVNILPPDFPQDVYTAVCNLVNVVLEMEAEEGVEEAIVLRGHITRKLIKQIVMTNVYSSTTVGSHRQSVKINVYDSTLLSPHKQIVNKLCEIPGIKHDKVQHFSIYLTHKVFDFLSQMFTGAHTLRGWLYETARRISESVHVQALKQPSKPKKTSKKDKNNTKSTTKAEDEDDEEIKNTHSEQDETRPMTCVIWTTPLGLPIVQPYRYRYNRTVSNAVADG
jgi:DNA-directed RNA polymerase